MILLLDSHVLAWWWVRDRRLTSAIHDQIADSANRVLISAATPWEMGIKHAAGRWPVVGPWLQNWEETMEAEGFETLPILPHHAIHAAALDWPHRDPFDRILAAQARLEGARLVTADAWMLGYLPDALDATKG